MAQAAKAPVATLPTPTELGRMLGEIEKRLATLDEEDFAAAHAAKNEERPHVVTESCDETPLSICLRSA